MPPLSDCGSLLPREGAAASRRTPEYDRGVRLLAVAFKPRSTIREIPSSHRAVIALVFTAFISSALGDFNVEGVRQAAMSIGPALTILAGIGICLALGILAVGFFYLFAWVATIAGAWLEGNGPPDRVRTALAWGFAPMILGMLYRIPAAIFWPRAVQTFHDKHISFTAVTAPPYQMAIIAILNLIFLAWYLTVASQTLAEVQGFSSWRGLANLLLAYVLPLIALAVIGVAAFLALRR